MKLIIYHGKQGTGKTTLLEVAASNCAEGNCDSQRIIQDHIVLTHFGAECQFMDEFNFDTDLELIDPRKCDWLSIATQKLPDQYEKLIFNKFGMYVDIYEVRETMFPLCNYVSVVNEKFVADFGAISSVFDTREEMIKELSSNPSKEVIIPDVESMALFLEDHGNIRPKNFSEWGLDWAHLQSFAEKFRHMTDNKMLVTENEACAIVNFNAVELQWIEDLFFNLFREE